MISEDADALLEKLEPEGRGVFLISDGGESGLHVAIQMSVAISLKRLADFMEDGLRDVLVRLGEA